MCAEKRNIISIHSDKEMDSSNEVYVFPAKCKWPIVDNEDHDFIEIPKKRKVPNNCVEVNGPNVSGDDFGQLESQLNLKIAEVSSSEETAEHFKQGDQNLCELKNVPYEYAEMNVQKPQDVEVKLDSASSPPIIVKEDSGHD